MKCPACGHSEAYLGFASVDCPNPDCKHYSASSDATSAPIPFSATTSATNGNWSITLGGATLPSPIISPTGLATLNLSVDITASVAKRTTVLISLVAHGDPGFPNKNVELTWTIPGPPGSPGTTPRICTLSGRHNFLLTGVDADGQTVYTTHWQCTLDGVQPTDPWVLNARIFP